MDVNGTKFHLLYGLDDWGRCLPQDAVSSGSGALTLLERLALPDPKDAPAFDWHSPTRSLRLARQTVIFRRSKRSDPLPLSWRRGAGRDQYGHWYWIDEAESGIRFLAHGENESVVFWDSTARPTTCDLPGSGEFISCPPLGPSPLRLRGLAVTTGHYLVVGNVTEHGLLIFDLHRGGPPMLMVWPEDVPFVPWDIAATPDGGVLILDRDNLHYWALDHNFRLAGEITEQEALFQPEAPAGEPEPPRLVELRAVRPLGFSLFAAADTPPTAPISIEPGPDGHVLILDAAGGDSSVIYEYDGESVFAVYSLADAVSVFNEDEDGTGLFSVNAHDFAYVECCTGGDDCTPCLDLDAAESGPARPLRLIFVAERDGDQVLAFEMRHDLDTGPFLDAQPDFLPLRRWEGKGLVTAANDVYYDFAGRWVPLSVFTDCRYATRAVLWTPPDFEPGLPEQLFDSNLPGCEWHRLLFDASIPAGTAVFVRARAADDLDLIEQVKWIVQPIPYLRSADAELPFYDTRLSQDPAQRAGTWELLFQQVQGRYLQLELTLEGTGRSTPVIYALRTWYPRFSYLHHYLPVIFREEPLHASFLDRWLANYEGFYTNLEDRIEHLPRLLDPRSAPQEALDWLASWLGLVLDPLWAEDRRRFFIQYAHELFKWRGTVRGLVMVLRVYLDHVLDPAMFDPDQYDISFLDDSVRVVENFLTRGGLSLQYGDASGGNPIIHMTIDQNAVEANAHRFTVLVPHCLTDEQAGMVERIIELEKPAHTAFVLKRYWDLFRVGEARLGLDTQLGYSSAFSPIVLGDSYLPEGYLQPPYPYDVGNRIVLTRDRLGEYPEL